MTDNSRTRRRTQRVCIPPDLQEPLTKLAKEHGFSKETYLSIASCDAIRKGRKFEAVEAEEKIAEDVTIPQAP